MIFWNIIIAIAAFALQMVLAPKPQNAKPASLEDFKAPTAEEGREIPVAFGTVDFADPNVTWYGDLKRKAIKGARRYGLFGPRQILGYKYYLGMQMGLCHGPADKLIDIRVGDKQAWEGPSTGGPIDIHAGQLFGGDQSEGGIRGTVDICMGAPDQLQNAYLVSVLGENQPAYRGVVTAVLERVYLGTSAYIKPWAFRLQRIYLRSDGTQQWYPEKAGIIPEAITTDPLALYFAIDVSIAGEFGLAYARIAIHGALAKLATDGADADIHMVAFGATILDSIEIRGVTGTDYDTLGAWVDALIGNDVDPDFGVGLSEAADFFDDSGDRIRRIILMSDGGDGTMTADLSMPTAQATIAGIDDLAVYCFLFARFLLASANLDVLDNTPDDQQPVTGHCPGYLTNSDALFSALLPSSHSGGIDMNPAHIIRECLTDATWGMGYNDSDIDDVSFTAAADTLYAERFGLSMKWYREEEIQEFVKVVQSHIDAYLYLSRSTGKFVLKLIRNDYDIGTIDVVDEDDVIEWTEVLHRKPSEAVSAVVVKFYNRVKRKDGSHTVTNVAQAMQTGKVISTPREYPGINGSGLAIRVGTRDVISLGSGMASGRLKVKRTLEHLNPGDPFRLVSTRHELDGQVMRVAELGFGDGRNNQIILKFVQDVFNLGAEVLVDTSDSDWENPSNPPSPAIPRLVWEMPFRELRQMIGDAQIVTMIAGDPDAGLLQIAGTRPTADALNAVIDVNSGSGFVESGFLEFAPGGFLDGALAIDGDSIDIVADQDLEDVVVGSLASIGGVEVVRIDVIAGNTLTIARGCLDTVPVAHADGAAVVFFDDFSLSDFETYTDADSVDVKLLTNTGLGQLAESSAPVDTVTFDSRAIRPLRPAGVTVEGDGYGPVDGTGLTDFFVQWLERNRLTESAPLSWVEPTVAPEDGQTTVLEILDPLGTTVLTTHSGLTGTSYSVPIISFGGNVSGFIRAGSERDGYREWQAYTIEVTLDDTGDTLVLGDDVLYLGDEPLFLLEEEGEASPVFTVAPVISGLHPVGSTLTVSDGTVTGTPTITYSYQWMSDGSNVGTDSNTYVIDISDDGLDITCVVTATNAFGSDSATSSNAITVGDLTDLITDTVAHTPPTTDPLPDYLDPYIDPTFGTTLTRWTGDPGTDIAGFPGKKWGAVARSQYPKHSFWNSDGTLAYLEHNSGAGAYSGNIFLDGETGAPVYCWDRPSGWIEARWDETDPTRMIYVTSSTIKYYDVTDGSSSAIHDFSGTYSGLTIGMYEGEISWDSDIVPIQATRVSDGHPVCFAYKISTNTVLGVIDLNSDPITDGGVNISPLGTYMVLGRDDGTIDVYTVAGSFVINFPEDEKPSHYSFAVESGIEYIVGGDRSAGGEVIKRRLSNGTTTVINEDSFTYHTSCRSHAVGTEWISTDYWPDSGSPYVSEIVVVAMDGSVVGRVCHTRKSSTISYDRETHGNIHPFGKMIAFQTDWGNGSGPVVTMVADFRDRSLPGVF